MQGSKRPRTIQPAHKSDKITVAQARETWRKIYQKESTVIDKADDASRHSRETAASTSGKRPQDGGGP